jgi:hypothetical protein
MTNQAQMPQSARLLGICHLVLFGHFSFVIRHSASQITLLDAPDRKRASAVLS